MKNTETSRWVAVVAVVAIAFAGAYAFAQTRGPVAGPRGAVSASSAAGLAGGGCNMGGGAGAGAGGSAGGGSCCGSGAQAPAAAKAPKQAEVGGNVQKIAVDVSKGYYDPSSIVLKAGVPAEITFSQSSGCTQIVQSQDLNFSADLGQGPQTVKLAALQPGTYTFTCGMGMVSGQIVVK